jgi:hypothetical protein
MKVVLERDPEVAVPLLMEHYRSRNEITLARFRRFEAGQTGQRRRGKRRAPAP